MKPFITLNNITIRLKDKFLFEDTYWVMNKGEDWLIVGANGAGKTTLAKAIAGELPLKQGEIVLNFLGDVENPYPSVYKDKISYLSFESHQKLVEQDNFKKDLQEFSGKKIKGIKVLEYLKVKEDRHAPLAMTSLREVKLRSNPFNIEYLLDQEISTLSTGEARKVQIIKALSKSPKLLILDEPFEGLDKRSKKELTEIIENLNGIQLILITHRVNEVPKNISNIMILEDGQIKTTGKKEGIKNVYLKSMTSSSDPSSVIPDVLDPESTQMDSRLRGNDNILELKNINIKIGSKQILKDINWIIKDGENWALLGPNGSGKSTLVKLILGEHSQAFSNDIKVFGQKLGEGISVWDIKKNIGVISSELMLNYRKEVTAYQVLLSGFFDSIGLYQKPSKEQIKKADEWVQVLGIGELIEKNFNELSFGQKRLVLITRAVVKSPKLLILDEPCHGLDINNIKKILELIEKIGKTETNILLITHNSDEIVPTITHTLKLDQGRVIT